MEEDSERNQAGGSKPAASAEVHTETAIEQIAGRDQSGARTDSIRFLIQAPQMKKDIAPIQEKTAQALEDYKKWLQNDLLKRADGDFRIGADKFRKKLRFALASDLSMEEVMKRAQAELAPNPERDLRNRAAVLQKDIFPRPIRKPWRTKRK